MPDAPANHATVEQSIPEAFEKIAQHHRARIALGSDEWCPTYEELNATANSLATVIASHGIQGDRVAVLMRHDAPLITTLMAVLKAGRVVFVLNPSDPVARLRQILDDAEPCLIVTDTVNRTLAGQIAHDNCRVIVFGENSSTHPITAGNLQLKISLSDPAFLIYTSGSTGRPKGVIQTHRNLLHNDRNLAGGMNVTAHDRIVLLASPSGAQGVYNTLCALLNGAALHPFPAMERGVTGLDQWLRARDINVYVSSASLFRNFVHTLKPGARPIDLRLVRLGSESSTADDFIQFKKHFREDCELFHTLASSEAGHIARFSLKYHDKLDGKRLPVGRAVDGVEILLLDDEGREVRAGDIGEMVIKSRYLSPGYWRNELLTTQKFSIAGTDGLRAFHSGDLGYLNAEGLLMHAGRRDAQVKIHGYRVELSEIEDALCSLPEIEKAVLCARKQANDDAQLAAYIIPRRAGSTPESLRNSLRSSLPAHMVPATFVFVEKFPLTPHGKVDRVALQQIQSQPSVAVTLDAPKTEMEIFLAGVWRQIFSLDSIGRNDDFFNLGGDSLMAAIVAARIFDQFGVELHLHAFVDSPTLAELAAKINVPARNDSTVAVPKIIPLPRGGPFPLSFQQEQMWKRIRKDRTASGSAQVARSRKIRGPLDIELLRDCMSWLARRHEILRTTFEEMDGEPVQIINPPGPVTFPQFDFSGKPDAELRAMELLRQDARNPFDLKRGPLVRFHLVQINPDEHLLLIVSHHLVTDAWSWKLYFRELGLLYEAKQRGQPPPLPDFQLIQYADYAAWQRKHWQPGSTMAREELKWWSDYSSFKPRPADSPFAWNHWTRKLTRGSQRAARLPAKRLLKYHAAKPSDGTIWWGVDPAASRRLDQIARQESATFYMTRLAAFAALLTAESGRADLALGIYLTQRSRLELQEVFGYFVNHAALRLSCDLNQTFRQWLRHVRESVGEVQAHGEMPFELLREKLRKTGVKPLKLRIYFNVVEHSIPMRSGDIEWSRQERIRETMPQAFGIIFDQHNEHDRCTAAFDARIYHPARVKEFLDRLARFLEIISNNPDKPLGELVSEA